MCCRDDLPASPLIYARTRWLTAVCLTTLSVAGHWVQLAETSWRKDIVKVIGNNTGPASDRVFKEFMDSWLQGSLDLPMPSEMHQSQLVQFSGKSLRRYSANRSSVSPLLPDYLETGG